MGKVRRYQSASFRQRVALNYLQRMSGIATYTHSVAKLLEGTKTKQIRENDAEYDVLRSMQLRQAADIITDIICRTEFC